MDDSNKKEFASVLYTAGELYDKTLSKELLLMYFNILIKFSVEQVRKAVERHALDPKHGTFFPKPADIVRNIDGERQTASDRALIAWMEIERCMSRYGAYGTLELDDKQALMAVKSMGSWQHLCHTDRDKLGFKRQEFIKNYEALENTPIEMLPEKMLGIEDLHNQRVSIDSSASDLLKKLDDKNK